MSQYTKHYPEMNLDFYKVGHIFQYPEGTEYVYSNFTPRSNKHAPHLMDGAVFIGLTRYIKLTLIDLWDEYFFNKPVDEVTARFKRRMLTSLGSDINVDHITALHNLGYLPLRIKALPEGTLVPFGVPMFTVENTLPEFYWLTNAIETDISSEMWKPCTAATIAREYRKILNEFGIKTGVADDFIPFQAHDFSYRGMSGREDAANTGLGHLVYFTGSDNIPAINAAEDLYHANADEYFTAGSINATEHSVQCAGTKEGEFETYRRLITDVYPSGMVSIVSDTWDYWNVLTDILPNLRNEIMGRDGKLVVRPDCYDDQTQILTDSGWKYFSELTEDDMVAQVEKAAYEFVKPDKIIAQPYNGDMYQFSDHHGKVDLLVTPNHRMVVNRNGIEHIIFAENMTENGYHGLSMSRSAKAGGQSNPLTAIERLKIAFQADGSYCTKSTTAIRFNFAKARKIERMRKILQDAQLDYKLYSLADNRVEFNIKIDATQFCKDFSWVDFASIGEQWASDFCEELSHWDSSIRNAGRFKFDTTIKSVIEVVELVALAAGKGVLISVTEDNRSDKFSTVYTANILDRNTVGGQSWKKTKTRYNGTVYCVKVPSGKIIVKRNRCTMVCGNSGDPVHIITGYVDGEYVTDPNGQHYCIKTHRPISDAEIKGSIKVLYDEFGGQRNELGYIELDPHIGLIYGESITLERCRTICERLERAGFSTGNIVFGIGSYTYNMVSRDTLGIAIKATWCQVDGEGRAIFKDPKTDDGTKKSAKGLLQVKYGGDTYQLVNNVTRNEEKTGCLETVFENGKLLIDPSLADIRERAKKSL